MKLKNKFERFERQEEMIVVKRLTYLRIFVILLLLMSVDTFSSYIAVKHPAIYEINNLSSAFFNLGLIGLFIWYFFIIIFVAFWLIIVYAFEQTFFKHKAQLFRMKILYVMMGMYLFVFANNLRSIISVLT